jgi:hypothetical protein
MDNKCSIKYFISILPGDDWYIWHVILITGQLIVLKIISYEMV